MDAWTFRKRLTVCVLLAGLALVGFGLWKEGGAEWFAAALGVIKCVSSFPAC